MFSWIARHLHSVTAGTPEEEEKKKEMIEALDIEVAALTRQFPRRFQPPRFGTARTLRQTPHHVETQRSADT